MELNTAPALLITTSLTISNSKTFIFLALISFTHLFSGGCDLFKDESLNTTKILLQNQSNHEGIFIEFSNTDSSSITDQNGLFKIPNIPDGNYDLTFKYPYFTIETKLVEIIDQKIQSAFELELNQTVQFEIIQSNFFLSRGASDETFILTDSLSPITFFVKNLTEQTIELNSSFGNYNLLAFKPVDFVWPTYQNPDNLTDPCYREFGYYGPKQSIFEKTFQIVGNSTLTRQLSLPYLRKACFPSGRYELFIGINNDIKFPEHFLADLANDSETRLKKLNRSLFLKNELFVSTKLEIRN